MIPPPTSQLPTLLDAIYDGNICLDVIHSQPYTVVNTTGVNKRESGDQCADVDNPILGLCAHMCI